MTTCTLGEVACMSSTLFASVVASPAVSSFKTSFKPPEIITRFRLSAVVLSFALACLMTASSLRPGNAPTATLLSPLTLSLMAFVHRFKFEYPAIITCCDFSAGASCTWGLLAPVTPSALSPPSPTTTSLKVGLVSNVPAEPVFSKLACSFFSEVLVAGSLYCSLRRPLLCLP
uniref:Uncharacterized protein n=1 Tax=Rhipicephalus microplus TaxID=6941 RepID=A0A6G5A6H0_RHIMP